MVLPGRNNRSRIPVLETRRKGAVPGSAADSGGHAIVFGSTRGILITIQRMHVLGDFRAAENVRVCCEGLLFKGGNIGTKSSRCSRSL